MSLKFDKQPKKLSDIPEIKESSRPHMETFENQAYSTNTLENTYTTIEQENPYDHVLGTKTAPHKEKSKKDQCERNLVWIMISVIILLLLAVGAVAVAALVQVSKLNISISPPGTPGKQGPPEPHSGGTLYTRWGKSTCPQVEGTDLVYSGIAGGTWYTHRGGGANYLCMPKVPEYSPTLRYRGGTQGYAYVYGAEYEQPLQGGHDHNVPCAVCRVSTRSTVLMIPAKATCPSSWTREYYEYIMTEWRGTHNSSGIVGRTMFECVDRDQESLPGGHTNTNGALFCHVEASCNPAGLPCPPYDSMQALNCVVCTK